VRQVYFWLDQQQMQLPVARGPEEAREIVWQPARYHASIEAMMLFLNYTLAGKKLGVSAKTVKRRMKEYGYSMQRLRELKSQRARQGRLTFQRGATPAA
jgi:hypothetical protein